MSEAEREKSRVYVEMPRGFAEPGKVIRFRKSLYGLKQKPRNFFLHLKSNLENIGFIQSEFDACLFISEGDLHSVRQRHTIILSRPRTRHTTDLKAQWKWLGS
jgi:hypothetical protein